MWLCWLGQRGLLLHEGRSLRELVRVALLVGRAELRICAIVALSGPRYRTAACMHALALEASETWLEHACMPAGKTTGCRCMHVSTLA